jgi:N-methylhydantoinase B
MRGGVTAEIAFTVRGVDVADALIMTHGLEVPNSVGLAGGAPGSQVRQRFGKEALPGGEFRSPPTGADPSSLGGEWQELGPKPGLMPMDERDVVALTWQGGGGFGDPLERDPDGVWQDVRAGFVSPAAAESVYGLVLDGGGFDAEATERRRRDLRQTIIGTAPVERDGASEGEPLGDSLSLVRDGEGWAVVCCGEPLTRNTTRWRAGAVSRPFAMPPGNPPLHPDLAMTAWYCPRCGRRLAVDVHGKDETPEDDVVLDLTTVP